MSNCYHPPTDRELLKMFILDVLRYDIEKIDSIISLMNDDGCIGWRKFWQQDFNKNEVIVVLPEIVHDGHIVLYEYSEEEKCLVVASPVGQLPTDFSGNEEKYWYLLTNKGKALWDRWAAPVVKGELEEGEVE